MLQWQCAQSDARNMRMQVELLGRLTVLVWYLNWMLIGRKQQIIIMQLMIMGIMKQKCWRDDERSCSGLTKETASNSFSALLYLWFAKIWCTKLNSLHLQKKKKRTHSAQPKWHLNQLAFVSFSYWHMPLLTNGKPLLGLRKNEQGSNFRGYNQTQSPWSTSPASLNHSDAL